MQASLVNLFKQLISENFLLFVDVKNFLQNTCPTDCLENSESFKRLYKGNVEGKRGYVWIDCPNWKHAFEMIYKHDCFIYKIRISSFDETKKEENLNIVCDIANTNKFTAFIEHNFVVFPIDARHFDESTRNEFTSFSAAHPVECSLCEKTAKNERGLKRHYKLHHSSKLRVQEEI